MKLPYYHIDPLKIDLKAVTQVMSSEYAQRRGILPVEVSGKEVTIATSEPLMTGWEAELSQMLRLNIKRVLSNPVEIERYQGEFFNLAKSMKRAESAGVADLGALELRAAGGARQGRAHARRERPPHRPPGRLAVPVRLRPARERHPRRAAARRRASCASASTACCRRSTRCPYSVLVAMTSRIKILGRMDVVEKRRPQDGRIKTRMPDGEEIELRLSTLPTAHGEKLVMRIFDPEVLMRDFKDLGFTKEEHEMWQGMIKQPGGILLVTGPTGSGKTTTLYTTLKQLATSEVNVCTIEDPIEMVDPRLNQMQVHTEIDLTFAAGVRALMRQDPDIVMVGEIRDLETADMAIQAALTGHLVLSTLHTNDAPNSITRLLDLGAPAYLLNSTLIGIMAQRLVRTLCPHCKEKVPFNREEEHALWHSVCAPFKAAAARRGLPRRGLPRVPQHRLHGPHRHLRDPADHARDQEADPQGNRHGGPHAGRLQGRDAPAARLRRHQGGAGPHDIRRGAQSSPVGLTGSGQNESHGRIEPPDPVDRRRRAMERRSFLSCLAAAFAAAFAFNASAQTITLHGASQFSDDHAFTKAMVKFEELVKKYYGKPINFVLHKNSELGLEKDYFAYMNQGKAVDYAHRLAGAHVHVLEGGAVHRRAVPVPRPRPLEQGARRRHPEARRRRDRAEGRRDADRLRRRRHAQHLRQQAGEEPRRDEEPQGARAGRARSGARPSRPIGMSPTVIAYNEVYNAIQNGVIAAGENEAAGVEQMKFFEVAPNLSMTQHAITIRPLCFSGKTFKGLPADLQAAILKAGKEAGAYGRQIESSEDAMKLDAMEKAGKLKRIPFTDRAQMKKLVDPVMESYAKEIGAEAIFQKINAVR